MPAIDRSINGGPYLAQPTEELRHEVIVKVVATVEDNALDGQTLREVLRRLSLSCSGGPGRGAT